MESPTNLKEKDFQQAFDTAYELNPDLRDKPGFLLNQAALIYVGKKLVSLEKSPEKSSDKAQRYEKIPKNKRYEKIPKNQKR